MKAADLMKKLEASSEYQEMQVRKSQELEERKDLLAHDERSLIDELNFIGYNIDSVWDFVNNNNRYEFLRKFNGNYSSAYPVLVKHLNMAHHPRIKEGIIRALTEKSANEVASEALIGAFYREQDSNLKWVFANALRTVLTRKQKLMHPEYKKVYSGACSP